MRRHLYLHGFGSGPSSQKANWFRERFADRGLDLELPRLVPGAFAEMTITSQLEALAAAVGESEGVALVGSSMGGYVGALYAAAQPERVCRLVLLAPAFGFPARWLERLPAAELEAWRRTGYKEVYHWEAGTYERLGFGIVTDGGRYPEFPAVSQPTLVLHGEADETVPVAYSETFVAATPSARLVRLPSDHSLTDVLEPMWDEIVPFLFGAAPG